MASSQDKRGFFRRYMFIHSLLWVVFIVVAVAVIAGNPNWRCAWILLFGLLPPILALPNLLKFRRVSRSLDYTLGTTLRQYFLGMSTIELEKIIEAQRARAAAWERLLQEIATQEPQLKGRIETLKERDNLEGAQAVLERAQHERARAEEQRQAHIQRLRAEAVSQQSSAIVEPLLADNNIKAAEGLLTRCSSLLERAKQLGVQTEAVKLLGSLQEADFSSIETMLRQTQDGRSMTKLRHGLEARIAAARPHDQDRLRQLLTALVQLPFGSRDFRKACHQLEGEIDKALGIRR